MDKKINTSKTTYPKKIKQTRLCY